MEEKTISDIDNEYFNHLINYSRRLEEVRKDMHSFHGIEIDKMQASFFPSEDELNNMRKVNSPLTDEQWNDFWKIIKQKEALIAETRVSMIRNEIELNILEKNHPTKFDKDGYAYREFIDYDGRPYREYIEMGN